MIEMKRVVISFMAVMAVTACCRDKGGIVLDEFAAAQTFDNAAELCEEVLCAGSYEEFLTARQRLTDYREAYRTQLGGEVYTDFLEVCDDSLIF